MIGILQGFPHSCGRRLHAYAASLAAARAGVKFVPHNTPAFSRYNKQSHFTASGNLPTGGIKGQGYTSEADLFCFLAVLRP